jgi:hypothetical protein
MDTPDPHRMTRRKKFDAFEQGITGGQHIGHLPVYVLEIEGWTFRRCRCGFSLALTPSGAIWWLRTTKEAMQISSFKSLLRALRSDCWAHPRPKPLTNAVIAAPAIAEIAAEIPQSSRFRPRNQYSTSVIGEAKRAESEEQRGAGADAAGGKTATRQASADLCSQQHRAHNACAAKSTWSMTTS